MRKVLGKGLEAIIPTRRKEIFECDIRELMPARGQPRRSMNQKKLKELARSIKRSGVLQPILVRRKDAGYEIICGERRYRAAVKAGLKTIPAIVVDMEDDELFETSLTENIQREDLKLLDMALAIKKLAGSGLTHDEIAKRLGKSRPWVSNILRILDLPSKVLEALEEGRITLGHAKAILSLGEDEAEMVLDEVVKKGLSVRQTEELARIRDPKYKKSGELENMLREVLRGKVGVKPKGDGFVILLDEEAFLSLENIVESIKSSL